MSKPRYTIDVGIPLFNPKSEFRKTLESIVLQTRRPNKVIVIDDCSDFETRFLFNDFSIEFDFSRNEKNIGMSKNFSNLIKKSNADFFVYLSQDDYWDATFLEKLESALLTNNLACTAVPGVKHIFRNSKFEIYKPSDKNFQLLSENKFLNDFFGQKRINNAVYYGLWRRNILASIYNIIESENYDCNEKFPVMLGYLSGDFIGVNEILFFKTHYRRVGRQKLGGSLSLYLYWKILNVARLKQEKIILNFPTRYEERKIKLIKNIRRQNWYKFMRKLIIDDLLSFLSNIKNFLPRISGISANINKDL